MTSSGPVPRPHSHGRKAHYKATHWEGRRKGLFRSYGRQLRTARINRYDGPPRRLNDRELRALTKPIRNTFPATLSHEDAVWLSDLFGDVVETLHPRPYVRARRRGEL
jgi:hypothetical protein